MSAMASITVWVPLAIHRRPRRRTVVMPVQGSAPTVATRADPTLVKALARAFWYQRRWTRGGTPPSAR
jgi:hypothetical protein